MRVKYSSQGAEALEELAKMLEQLYSLLGLEREKFLRNISALDGLGEFEKRILENVNIIEKATVLAQENVSEVAIECIVFAERIREELLASGEGEQKVYVRRGYK